MGMVQRLTHFDKGIEAQHAGTGGSSKGLWVESADCFQGLGLGRVYYGTRTTHAMRSHPFLNDAKLLRAAVLGALSSVAMLGLAHADPGGKPAPEPKVIVHLLDPTGKKQLEERFWIDWNETWRGIEETKTLTGEAAEALIARFDKVLLPEESDNLCGHHPVYGIEVVRADGTTLKTSLCFSCVTWVKPKKRLTIAGKHGLENELCKTLRGIIELPKEVLEGKAGKP